MLSAYCIVQANAPAPGPETAGVDGASVRCLERGGLGLWLSAAPEDPRPSTSRVREHDAVVRAAMRCTSALPMRFGTAFPDEQSAGAALQEGAEGFLAALERVEGRAEMGLRVVWKERAPSADAGRGRAREAARSGDPQMSGRRFLEARRKDLETEAELRRRAEVLLDRVETRLAGLSHSTVRRVMPDPWSAGELAHLVSLSDIVRYRRAVERSGDGVAGVELVATGPFAPYSFV